MYLLRMPVADRADENCFQDNVLHKFTCFEIYKRFTETPCFKSFGHCIYSFPKHKYNSATVLTNGILLTFTSIYIIQSIKQNLQLCLHYVFYIKKKEKQTYGRLNINLELEYKTCGEKLRIQRTLKWDSVLLFNPIRISISKHFTLSCCANSQFYYHTTNFAEK